MSDQAPLYVAGELAGCLVATVTLDGVEQKHVVAADPPRGFVIRFATAADGSLAFDLERQELIQERIDGVVAVTFRDMPRALKILRGLGILPTLVGE